MPLRGQGDHGTNDGPPGDLYVRINVASSKKFTRKGNDIYIDTNILVKQNCIYLNICNINVIKNITILLIT